MVAWNESTIEYLSPRVRSGCIDLIDSLDSTIESVGNGMHMPVKTCAEDERRRRAEEFGFRRTAVAAHVVLPRARPVQLPFGVRFGQDGARLQERAGT